MPSSKHSRQSFLGPDSERALAKVRALTIGLGGGGSHVAQQLAHVGVGVQGLVDPQEIEISNLNRLIGGTQKDIKRGTPKVKIAARLIRAIMPSAHIIEIQDSWQLHAENLRSFDFMFGCVDSFRERDQLERMARRFLIPYADIGMDVHQSQGKYIISGQVALSLPNMPCLWCMGLLTQRRLEEEARLYGSAGGKPQVVWPNGALASAAVGLFMNCLFQWQGNFEIPLLLEYDGNRQTVAESNKMPTIRKMVCHHHDGSVGDPFWGKSIAAKAVGTGR